jgi:hypothetical protein
MQNVNLKKSTHKGATPKTHRINLKTLAHTEGIPEFMIRLAQERRVKISKEQVIPKYRHD